MNEEKTDLRRFVNEKIVYGVDSVLSKSHFAFVSCAVQVLSDLFSICFGSSGKIRGMERRLDER